MQSLDQFLKLRLYCRLSSCQYDNILFALLDTEMCVMHISERLGMTSSAISHQLKVLKDNNLVACRREGKTIFYYLADDHVHTIVAQGYEHLKEKEGTEK